MLTCPHTAAGLIDGKEEALRAGSWDWIIFPHIHGDWSEAFGMRIED